VILNYYVTRLQPYLKDPDPIIAGAMADVFGLMYGTRPAPAPARRRINQPAASLFSLGSTFTVLLDSGDDFNIELNSEEAPLTVARFTQLARFYEGQFFYRLLPLNLIQAGSTGANDMMSYGRFIRDELGRTMHRHGTVGWFSQGPDTGDSQFFINLLDAPARHRQYTVLGLVGQGHKQGVIVPGMDVVLDLIEGARIVSIRGASGRR
jgi:peptidylprolyl isomerase